MLIERIWSGNPLRNFHYLIACPETGEALAVDPLEWRLCLDAAQQKGWTITQILNTHEHPDHTGGNEGLVGATKAKVLAHAGAAKRIGGVDRGLSKGDVIKVGRTVVLRLRFGDLERATRSHTLPFATANTQAILITARALLATATPLIEQRGITLVGCSVAMLEDARTRQLLLGPEEAVDAAVDAIRDRYGSSAITRAVLLGREPGFSMPLLPD